MRQHAARDQQRVLDQQARVEQNEIRAREAERESEEQIDSETANVQSTIGGRNASMPRPAIGDLDARTPRYPGSERAPMLARQLTQEEEQRQRGVTNPAVEKTEEESPWTRNRGSGPDEE